MNNIFDELQQQLAQAGFQSSIVSVQHVPELQHDLEHLLEQGILSRDFYNEIVSRYSLNWKFKPSSDFPAAKSIIVTAAPQPKVRIKFNLSDKVYLIILPPTYVHDSDKTISFMISHYLDDKDYNICDADLPEKLLAVHCGLAVYGKNNIAYIGGLGSCFRLKAFFSDIPCDFDNWHELTLMDQCHTCSACIKKCPSNAISKTTFLVDAARCLTYFNEGKDDFPGWIDPEWHNCLLGCMICQDICPVNKDNKNWIVDGEEFSEQETRMILAGVLKDKLAPETMEKLDKLYLADDYELLQRNLGILIEKKIK